MFSIKGRILFSYLIFVLVIIILGVFAFKFINKAERIRTLQSNILEVSNKFLLLVDADVALRTEGILEPDFYRNSNYPALKNRERLFEEVEYQLRSIEKIQDELQVFETIQVSSIQINLETYNDVVIQLIKVLKKRGFKDDGLEGTMRSYAHQLEQYPESILPEKVLSLRRHEKDYFLRSDTAYVVKFNLLSNELITKIEAQQQPNKEVLNLLSSYTKFFNEIVVLERLIGNFNLGLIAELEAEKKQLILTLSQLIESTNEQSNEEVKTIFRKVFFLAFFGLMLTTIIGYFSADIVSSSIKNLAISMKRAVLSNFKNDVYQPSKFAARETKSLYASYERLNSTIKSQFTKLELANDQLENRNFELNQLIKKLQESEENLLASNELKNKFFSIIAHDLKSPISSLTMLLDYMTTSKGQLSQAETDAYLDKLFESTLSIASLLDNLLSWARSQNNYLVPIKKRTKLRPLIEPVLGLNAQRIEDKKLAIKNDIPEDLYIEVDKDMMDLVFRNLIDNAIKYSHEGGQIIIGQKRLADKLQIFVSDTGVGLEESDRKKIFKSLVMDQKKGTKGEKGIGLGLMLVYDFIRKNGGSIKVESEVDEGTTFILSFPLTS